MAKITLTDKEPKAQAEIKQMIYDMIKSDYLMVSEVNITHKGNRAHITIKGHRDEAE